MAPPAGVTPSQTVGPFWAIALPWATDTAFSGDVPADAVVIWGHVLDGAGDPVPDAIVESWQADGAGRFDHPDDPRGAVAWEGFRGFARACADVDGRYRITTLVPGAVPAADGTPQAPHLLVSIFARGLLDRVVTRIYFGDQSDANAADPVLATIPADRRETLIARPVDGGYRLDIHLQGPQETVFFAL